MKITLVCLFAFGVPPILFAQIPPSIDPSQVVSGITASGQYDYQLKDGSEAHGVIMNNVDPKTGNGVIFTFPDNGPFTTTLVSPGLSVTY